jgi:hypothetical protein
MRSKATYLGAGITTGAFVANEFVRMTSRSPLFKLKLWNAGFWLLAPTFCARSVYN